MYLKRIIKTHSGLDVSAKQSYPVCTKTLFTPMLIMKKQTLAQDAFKLYAERFMPLNEIAKKLKVNEKNCAVGKRQIIGKKRNIDSSKPSHLCIRTCLS